jgi:two-component system nitrate/nitrite response regulator NarL
MADLQPVRLVIVDDSADYRATLVDLFDGVGGVEVVAQGESGEQAARLVKAHRADAVILDLRMPVTGWAAINALRRARPLVKIIVLSASGEQHQQPALRAGADAYVRKSGRRPPIDELTDALARATHRSELKTE